MDYNATVDEIKHNIEVARRIRANLIAKIEELEKAGFYYPRPREDWQERESGQYLYLHFHSDGNGAYAGPNGKRKIYIGNKAQKIAEAQAMIGRGAEWRDAKNKARDLKYLVDSLEQDLDNVDMSLKHLLTKSTL